MSKKKKKKQVESKQDLDELSYFYLSLGAIFHSVFYGENRVMNNKS